jgi:hypothetical protein
MPAMRSAAAASDQPSPGRAPDTGLSAMATVPAAVAAAAPATMVATPARVFWGHEAAGKHSRRAAR